MADPKVFIGLLIGGAVPFLFSSLAIRAVGRTAGVVVQEVRSQFADGKIMTGEKKPDYGPVIDICTPASLRELTTPALLAVLTPVIIGFGIGYTALGGFLAAVILVGQLMANYLSNAGGAWDNAKKYIEDGHHGGKGSEAHKAAVIGDTVGDPFKDTAGPALNPLIKVMNLVSLLILPAIISLSNVSEDNVLSTHAEGRRLRRRRRGSGGAARRPSPTPSGRAPASRAARAPARPGTGRARARSPSPPPRRSADRRLTRPHGLHEGPVPRDRPLAASGRATIWGTRDDHGEAGMTGSGRGTVARIDRRRFLAGSAAAVGGAAVAGPFAGFLAGPAAAADPPVLGPVPDERDAKVRLWLPPGFHYRSFHDTDTVQPVVLDDGTILPGRHDGMAAFAGPDGNYVLVRNHEVNNPVPAFGDASKAYDAMAGGGTTTTVVSPFGEVVSAFTSLNGTQMNCSGGPMPWDSWLTCEETINGPDVGADFTGVSNVPLTKPHGFVFEVPAGGQSDRVPITGAGRFAHEAAAFDSRDGVLYLTEDNFGFPSGFYRYLPDEDARKARRISPTRAAADAGGQGRAQRRPGRHPAGGRQLQGDLGRHRRPGAHLPLHPRRARPDPQRHRHQPRRRPGPGPGGGVVLAAGGRGLRQGHRLLHLHPGRRPRRARPERHGRRLGQRERPDLGLRHRVGPAEAGLHTGSQSILREALASLFQTFAPPCMTPIPYLGVWISADCTLTISARIARLSAYLAWGLQR